LGNGDAVEAFVFAVEAFDEAATFAVDLGAENMVAGAVGMPASGPIASGEDSDAFGADCGGQVHGAGVVANVKDAGLEGASGSANREGAGSIVTPAPLGKEVCRGLVVLSAAEDDGPDVELVDQGLSHLSEAFERPLLSWHF
jgi:hypothetical protein